MAPIMLAILPWLGACASLPAADAPTPGAVHDVAAAQSLAASPDARWPREDWWRAYGDNQLGQLIDEGLAHSPDAAAAAARLRKASAIAGTARAALLPKLDGLASVGDTKLSYNLGYPPQFVAFLPHGWHWEGGLDAALSFDLDLWGKARATLAAALSEREASAIDARLVRLTLATAIAEAYAALGGDITIRAARQATLDNRAKAEALITARVAQGLDTSDKRDIAHADTMAAHADLAAAEADVARQRDQLAALLGAGPDRGLAITPPRLAALPARGLPEGVTGDLLGRRADIAAARVRAAAAGARVRAAHADFYPAIRLSALVGYQALGLDNLLKAGSTMGTVGPALSLPLFHAGEIRARYRGAEADYDSAVADYNRAVIAAYQQLADAVTARSQALTRRDDAEAAVHADEDALRLTQARAEHGLGNALDVLASEQRLIAARAARDQLDIAARLADIALIRALGGGFDSRPMLAADTSTSHHPTQGSTP